MPPTLTPLREDTHLRVMSITQRHLAPTVGPAASGGRNRAGSAFAGVGDTVAIGRVQYLAGRYPFVLPDECWIPARTDAVRLSIIPIGGIHIFIGETVNPDGTPLVSSLEPTANELVAAEQIRSETPEPPKEDSTSDLENSKPTQPAPVQEESVEDPSRSTWVSEVFEKQRCHFVHFLGHSPGSASSVEPAGPAADVESVNKEDSVLDALDIPAGDEKSNSAVHTEEVDRWKEELGDDEDDADDSGDEVNFAPAQILATLAALGGSGGSEKMPSDAGVPALEAPPPPPVRPVDDLVARNLGEADEEETAAESILRRHGIEEGEKNLLWETPDGTHHT